MAETFDNIFHKRYVGGEGEIVEKDPVAFTDEVRSLTYDDVLAEYRWYMKEPTAELPEEIMEQLEMARKI